MGDRKRVLVLLIIVATFSVFISLLMSREESERGQQFQEATVSGKPASFTQRPCGGRCVFLPMIATKAGSTSQAGSILPEAAITVVAQASHVCGSDSAVPVAGARITVVTGHDSRARVTDSAGYVVFEPTGSPAVVQIEWPVGLLPCLNSRPMAELPSGAGEVKFLASAAAYP